jgi:hypothetical protein
MSSTPYLELAGRLFNCICGFERDHRSCEETGP